MKIIWKVPRHNPNFRPSKPRKRKYQGNQFNVLDAESSVDDVTETSEHAAEAGTSEGANVSARKIKTAADDIVVNLTHCYRIIEFFSVFSALSDISVCRKCKQKQTFGEVNNRGLGFKISVKCLCGTLLIKSGPFVNNGYEINRRIVFSMRLLGELHQVLHTVSMAATWSGLRFKPRKCASLLLDCTKGHRQLLLSSFDIQGRAMRTLKEGESYKYLGAPLGWHVTATPTETIATLKEEIRAINNSNLAPWQKLDATRTFLLPKLEYPMRISDFPKGALNELEKQLNAVGRSWMWLPQSQLVQVDASMIFSTLEKISSGMERMEERQKEIMTRLESSVKSLAVKVLSLEGMQKVLSDRLSEGLQTLVHKENQPATFYFPLPINYWDEFSGVMERVKDDEMRGQMITFFSKVGGKDTTSLVNRIMSRIIANALAETCNWKGAVISHVGQETVTEAVVKERMQHWLKQASRRGKTAVQEHHYGIALPSSRASLRRLKSPAHHPHQHSHHQLEHIIT
ncbi:hypothetical protein J437_LFUL016912 [Ladona fulva]|uniref:DUF4806 domain-containing protein n=1 Tax=Ladona fulva TaxID=123851 RepID=A0A8K0KJL1_LADFU|nr:hypothetical protein J437_LFUL016912 [Ladona fulva]